jgi:hypothetical protein
VVGVFMSLSIYQGRTFGILTNMVDMDQGNRTALDRLTKDIRQANRVTSYGTNTITFEDFDGLPLVYTYTASNGKLTRTKGTSVTTLLKGCTSLTFNMYQRNMVAGSSAYYPAATLIECKVVGIDWVCSRKIMGVTSNVTGPQSARVVIRKA